MTHSCINQLLSIIHEILSAFDKELEVRGIFLNISKAFDKVWHEGLIFKLRQIGISGDIINILQDFLRNRKQRVVLNGQCSSWADVNAGFLQGSILGLLLFLIYINDLSDGLKSECKQFADDTSLFSVVNDINTSASDLNEDLEKIGNWAFKWKMNFISDPNKQAQEIIFSRKKTASLHPVVYFDNKPVKSSQIHKHLVMILDSNLSYEHHIKSILSKVNKRICFLRRFQLILPRHSIITIYKSFIRPHPDYGDVIYDRAFNESYHQRLESSQYNAAIAITGSIRWTSLEKIFQELGLETLKSRRWSRKLVLFYKTLHRKSASYLFNSIPENNHP